MSGGGSEDVLISADVEADGPIPGEYSMLSLGFSVAGTWDGGGFHPQDPRQQTFYRELRPITGRWNQDALRVSRLDRSQLRLTGSDPGTAMAEAAAWVRETAGTRRPVLIAYPLAFDWMFIQWYFVRFAETSPFGHGSALDIKTAYQQKAGVPMAEARRDAFPLELRPDRPPVHNALEDAIDQARLFQEIMAWDGKRD